MFEHVGVKNYREFMEVVHRCLNDNGLFVLHTIGSNITSVTADPWTEKYIFPNGHTPSIAQIGTSIERLFVMEDWHNFGPDYDRTLRAWCDNFQNNWDKIADNYGPQFYRKWRYYLLACAGGFRARGIQLWQVVLSKNGFSEDYVSVR
jgi:cyclopropane-fatty-acyl-phospholipid synthase